MTKTHEDYATTYSDGFCQDYEAYQIPWAVVETVLTRRHRGDSYDDETLVAWLRAIGAPKWVLDAEGWLDEGGWGIYGPKIEEASDE